MKLLIKGNWNNDKWEFIGLFVKGNASYIFRFYAADYDAHKSMKAMCKEKIYSKMFFKNCVFS